MRAMEKNEAGEGNQSVKAQRTCLGGYRSILSVFQ